MQSSKNVGGGIFSHDIYCQFSDIHKYLQAMFSSQIFEYLSFSFSTVKALIIWKKFNDKRNNIFQNVLLYV